MGEKLVPMQFYADISDYHFIYVSIFCAYLNSCASEITILDILTKIANLASERCFFMTFLSEVSGLAAGLVTCR